MFPHHECEAAQSEAATGQRFVRHWLHAPMVRLEGEKMSKSRGNLVFVSDLVKEHDAMAVRLALLDHGREDWEWHEGLLTAANERLAAWHAAGPGDGGLEDARAALDDDLDLPAALVAVDQAAGRGQGVGEAAALLGVTL